jgi:amino acid adenylation domain-containing protein
MSLDGDLVFSTDPASWNLFALFERRASETPDALAVIDAEGEITYGDLLNRAEAVHVALAEKGITPEEPVVVFMHKRVELVAALLGILRAGGTYVPVDSDDPPDRIRRIAALCGARIMVSEKQLSQRLDASDLDDSSLGIVLMEGVSSLPVNGTPPPAVRGTHQLAYLIFTSGTTGTPKAVAVSHTNVVHLLRSARRLLGFTRHDRYLATSTIAFDASVAEIFLPLTIGGSMLMRDRSDLSSPRRLADDVRAYGVSVVQFAPSVWVALLKDCPDFPKVRVAITHGEAVTPKLATIIASKGDNAWNLYGPTETTVWATGWRLSPEAETSLSPLSAAIGRPLDHIRSYVLDPEGREIDGDAEGELWLAGPSVARGYFGDEELAGQRFRNLGGDKAYRTGDRVRRDDKGVLHYFGRFDEQMQIRGVRVEPQEIEAALLQDAAVAQAAVTWFETTAGGRGMVAAIVPRPGLTPRPEDIQARLATRVPRRMMPTRFLLMQQLPTTPSGKIDREKLRTTVLDGHRDEPMPPHLRTKTEKDLATIWCRLLRVPAVSRDDHFFTIGGDSLSALALLAEVEAQCGVQLLAQAPYDAPILAALAHRIDAARATPEQPRGGGFVVRLGGSGSGCPLFVCQLNLKLLLRTNWNPSLPVFSVMYWTKSHGIIRGDSLEELAAIKLAHIRKIQSSGPYRLGGYSFGGLVAYEMAQQLMAAGEKVELLVLLDPTPPGHSSPRLAESLVVRALNRLRSITRGRGTMSWLAWFSKFVPLSQPLQVRWLPHFGSPWRAYQQLAMPLRARYIAAPYSGRTLFVECTPGHGGRAAFGDLLPSHTRILNVDASHQTLFDSPALEAWTSWLEREIRQGEGAL